MKVDHSLEEKILDVIFYTKEKCLLCEDALDMLRSFQDDYLLIIEERDIYTNKEWLMDYQIRIPVIEINGEQLDCEEISYKALSKLLQKNT